MQVAVQITFWLTLTFAIIERTQTAVDVPEWTVDQLPDAPVRRGIPLADTIASVIMLVLTIAYLPFQHYHSWVRGTDGENIPILDPALWSFWLPALIVVLALSVIFESRQVPDRRAGPGPCSASRRCSTWPSRCR